MLQETKILFFIGKGGVGKSTVSALSAMEFSLSGKKTLLVSLDPAHNQCDIFEKKFSQKKTAVNKFLDIIEIDIEKHTNEYLKETREKLNNLYSYQTSFNLQGYFKILKFSPGIEEYALLHSFEKVINSNEKYEYYVFDMPPTALTLKFFYLPHITLIWTKELLKLRNEILKKKEIITKIKLFSKEIESDKVLLELKKVTKRQNQLFSIFKSEKCIVNLVANSDKLSSKEAFRIIEKVKKIDMNISNIILNKMDNKSPIIDYKLPTIKIPFNDDGFIGYDHIKSFINSKSIFENMNGI